MTDETVVSGISLTISSPNLLLDSSSRSSNPLFLVYLICTYLRLPNL